MKRTRAQSDIEFRIITIFLIDSFIWLVCRVEPMERAKVAAIGAGAGTFTVLPVDDLKNRA